MAKKAALAPMYYYAGKEKIELTPADDLFAVESKDVRSVAEASQSFGSALTDGLRCWCR